jgi:DNA-binding PadR family transcriptional regulator
MSSIRLFILSSFAELGPMHGHRLRVEAEQRHVDLWTDFTVGAVYGAMNRLAAEGLLRASGTEQEGNRPTRQIYEITDQGLAALANLRRVELEEIWFKYDPFDLALTRVDAGMLDELPDILARRLEKLQAMLETRRANAYRREQVGRAKDWALRHTEYRLEAEVNYLTDLLRAASEIIADERQRRRGASKKGADAKRAKAAARGKRR